MPNPHEFSVEVLPIICIGNPQHNMYGANFSDAAHKTSHCIDKQNADSPNEWC